MLAAGEAHVRSCGNCRLELLVLRISHFDPKRRFPTVNCCVAKGSFALDPEGIGRGQGSVVSRWSPGH
jgi:hypothetical protein